MLSASDYAVWSVSRDAGYTPREISVRRAGRKYHLTIEDIVPNAIAECYSGHEDGSKILAALQELHSRGVEPYYLSSTLIAFRRDGSVVFLTVLYTSVQPGGFDARLYAALLTELTSTQHVKRRGFLRAAPTQDEIAMYRTLAEIGVAPEVLRVDVERNGLALVTRRYPYTLDTARDSGVSLTEGAKRSLLARTHTMHLLGILHNDVDFDNFVCDLAGQEVYVIDFGMSIRLYEVSDLELQEYITSYYKDDGDDERDQGIPVGREALVARVQEIEQTRIARLMSHS